MFLWKEEAKAGQLYHRAHRAHREELGPVSVRSVSSVVKLSVVGD
jgi:hypothetical protein